ncbi:MAG: hypothetical protein A2Y77_03790 [Planctomycetes bacterium RBG_13_62_9]|nr:MAG: hypothetical protein A2Y77_03790 [Planctomycetes bacterium RBG_13_62_9]
MFEGKRVGIIANHTSYNSRGKYVVDMFRAMLGVQVVALFSPEHGVQGTAEAGVAIGRWADPNYGLPVHSLYGETKKPTPEMLANIDVLVFDIQDVGARFYTYVSTMALAMEAAAENGKPFVVLDRPNPLNGEQVEGEVLDPSFASFVGLYPIPVRHGMTVGELARMINGEGWLTGGVRADLAVVSMTSWYRRLWYDQTGLSFIRPSPNIPDLDTAAIYPGLCLLEGTNVSEGRGTPIPFRQFGAPWMNAESVCCSLNALRLPGAWFETTSFVPTSSKYKDQLCHGVRLLLGDKKRLDPFRTGVEIVNQICRIHPDQFQWNVEHFDRLCGTDAIRKAIVAQASLDELRERWRAECDAFRQARTEYLLYPE